MEPAAYNREINDYDSANLSERRNGMILKTGDPSSLCAAKLRCGSPVVSKKCVNKNHLLLQ